MENKNEGLGSLINAGKEIKEFLLCFAKEKPGKKCCEIDSEEEEKFRTMF